MGKYVAMIRGIGPGDPNMTKEKFTSFFEALGFTRVQVVLASGNIIFESASSDMTAMVERIEAALPQNLGFARSVIIRSQSQLQRLVAADPFKNIEERHNKEAYLLITFFRQPVHIAFALPYTVEHKPYTLLGAFEEAVYGVIDLTAGKTPDYMQWLEKQFGKEITSRTPKTIRLILARMNKSI